MAITTSARFGVWALGLCQRLPSADDSPGFGVLHKTLTDELWETWSADEQQLKHVHLLNTTLLTSFLGSRIYWNVLLAHILFTNKLALVFTIIIIKLEPLSCKSTFSLSKKLQTASRVVWLVSCPICEDNLRVNHWVYPRPSVVKFLSSIPEFPVECGVKAPIASHPKYLIHCV